MSKPYYEYDPFWASTKPRPVLIFDGVLYKALNIRGEVRVSDMLIANGKAYYDVKVYTLDFVGVRVGSRSVVRLSLVSSKPAVLRRTRLNRDVLTVDNVLTHQIADIIRTPAKPKVEHEFERAY